MLLEDLRSAWIGAKFENGEWRWNHSEVVLDRKQDPSTLFPPWLPNQVLKLQGCLQLNASTLLSPVFSDERCERSRGYICSRGSIW